MLNPDISDQVQLNDYRKAMALAPVPMLLASTSGEIILTNTLLSTLFEYGEVELIGKNVEVLLPMRDRQHHQGLTSEYFRIATKRRMSLGRDLVGLTSNGNEIALELLLDSVTLDSEYYALIVAYDITELKNHEKTMAMTMDAAASGMIMIDNSGHIKSINKAAVALFGYEASEIVDQSIEMLIPHKKRRVHEQFRNDFLNKREVRPMTAALEVFGLHREGHEIPVDVALTPVVTPEGPMVVSTILDLSERLATEREMARKSAELEAVNNELLQFAYSASHDLKAPLSSIVGLLAVCQEDLDMGDFDELRDNFDRIRDIAKRSAKRVEGVLQIASAGRNKIATTNIVFADLVNEIWLDLTGSPQQNMELKLDLDHTDPIILELSTCKTILENLLSNAIRYRDIDKPLTIIEVRTRSDTDNFEFSIVDNGIGVREESRSIIFDMFKRLHENSGDGLGLALVKKQVIRLGGQLELSSKEGEGSEFLVRLPLQMMDDS